MAGPFFMPGHSLVRCAMVDVLRAHTACCELGLWSCRVEWRGLHGGALRAWCMIRLPEQGCFCGVKIQQVLSRNIIGFLQDTRQTLPIVLGHRVADRSIPVWGGGFDGCACKETRMGASYA